MLWWLEKIRSTNPIYNSWDHWIPQPHPGILQLLSLGEGYTHDSCCHDSCYPPAGADPRVAKALVARLNDAEAGGMGPLFEDGPLIWNYGECFGLQRRSGWDIRTQWSWFLLKKTCSCMVCGLFTKVIRQSHRGCLQIHLKVPGIVADTCTKIRRIEWAYVWNWSLQFGSQSGVALVLFFGSGICECTGNHDVHLILTRQRVLFLNGENMCHIFSGINDYHGVSLRA